MGSFNTACMVSQQVIVPGAETFILPIQQQATYNPVEIMKDNKELSQYGCAHTSCYPTAFWGYAGPLIHGKYDDYGRFELINTNDNKMNIIEFFNYLNKNAFNTKQGKNQYHDHAFDMNSLYDPKKEYSFDELENIWNKVWDVTQENRVFVSNYQGEARNLQFAVIHHVAAEYLIDTVNKYKSYSGQSYDQKAYFKNYMQSQTARMIEIFEHKKELGDIFSFLGSQLGSLSNYGIGEQEGAYISQYYNSWNLVMDSMDKFVLENPNTKELSEELIDELFAVFETQIKHRYIHMGLDSFNIKLSPMVYASQDYDNSTGKSYAKMIKEVSGKITKEIKANNN